MQHAGTGLTDSGVRPDAIAVNPKTHMICVMDIISVLFIQLTVTA